MMPKDYEYLLVAANLAYVDKRWGFSIKMMKWRLFLEGHWFRTINCVCTFEVYVKKVDLNAFIEGESPKHREKVNFIRIGALKASLAGGMTAMSNDDDDDDNDNDSGFGGRDGHHKMGKGRGHDDRSNTTIK